MIEEILLKCCQHAPACPDHEVLRGSFLISYKQQVQERQKKFPGTLAVGGPQSRGKARKKACTSLHRNTSESPVQNLNTIVITTETVIRTTGIWEWFSFCPEANSKSRI